MFRVNDVVLVSLLQTSNMFLPFSNVSLVDFERSIVCWEVLINFLGVRLSIVVRNGKIVWKHRPST